MTFLPIVARELLEASRRRSTYWVRVASAAVGLAIGGFVLYVSSRTRAQAGQIGMILFVPLAIASFIYTLLIGVFRTADCLSEEKREGTLGLLFLTDLKGYDIVVGKLAATSLNAFYGALALFPVMAIPLLAGGVAIGDFWRVVMVSLNNLFFSLAVGMFCSSISRDERRAMALAFLMILFFTAGLPLLGAILCNAWRDWGPYPAFLIPSPGFDCFGAFEELRRAAGGPFKWFPHSVVFVHAMSWLFLIVACVVVPRTWQDKAATPAVMRRREKWRRLGHGSSERRRALRQRLLAINPFLWLTGRDRMKSFGVWAFLGLGAIIWAIGLATEWNDWTDPAAYFWTAVLVHSVLKIWLATEASRRFSQDRQSGALELLLATPIPVREIIRGQRLALEKQFALPVLVVLLVDFVFLMAMRSDSDELHWMIALMVMFVMDMVALAWVGMWRGLNSHRPNRAAAAAIARIMTLPWLAWLVIIILIAVSATARGGFNGWEGEFLAVLIFGLSVGVNLIFGLTARARLLSDFRRVATTRFETRGRM